MSYIQIEISGKPRGLKFNQMAVVTMTKYLDFDNVAATYGYALVYAGLVSGCYVKREEPDFTFEQVCDWVDDMPVDELIKIRDVFESTQSFKALISNAEEVTKKKPKRTKEKA